MTKAMRLIGRFQRVVSRLKRLGLLGLATLLSSIGVADENAERIVWDYTPIHVDIQVGTERRLEFPETVEIQLPKRLNAVSTIKVLGEGVIYWRVNEPFARAQVDVVTASGYQYLLNVAGIEEPAPTHPVIVVDPRYDAAEWQPTDAITPRMGVPPNGYSEIDVQRAVAQQLLRSVPKRLAQSLPGLVPIPVEARPVALYQGGELQSIPIYQVKAPAPNSFYVTAVKLQNRMSYVVPFSPLAIQGDFIAASPLTERLELAPHGEHADAMVVLLVSKRAFNEVLP